MTSDCPLPFSRYDRIVLGHGSGGRLSRGLLEGVLLPALGTKNASALEDQAVLALPPGRLALTTDSFVVSPRFFAGGDIGRLSVFGTVNDLAVGGAVPRYLALAFVLEEGLAIEELLRVAHSVRAACDEARVELVTGDTKVVERGKADGLYITTTGVGVVPEGRAISVTRARPGDQVVVSGPIGDHGIAVLAAREAIELETPLESDCAPLTGLIGAMLEVEPEIGCLRDPTRGGVSGVLHEIAAASRVGIRLDERSLPIRRQVHALCELLGFDPLYVACEGRVVAVVPPGSSERVVAAMRRHELGQGSAVIGEVTKDHPGVVTIRSSIGGERVVALLSGEQLPRIC